VETDHAILFLELDSMAGVSFEHRSAKSTRECRPFLNDRLQLFVVADQNDLTSGRRNDRNKAFCFFAHPALVYDQLRMSNVDIKKLFYTLVVLVFLSDM